MTVTSPQGTPIVSRPIEPDDLDRVVLRCWPPDRGTLERLLSDQGTIGMAAWEGDKCVGVLHGYRVVLPGWNDDWPEWNVPWWSELARGGGLGMAGPAWCHACCHVGRTLESARAESESDVSIRKGIEVKYLGRGIGTALGRESVSWARRQGYAAVLAGGGPSGLFERAVWSGQLPWTTYTKLGFEALREEVEGADLPAWARGDAPPEVMAEVERALAGGRRPDDMRGRLMVSDLS